MHPQLTNLLHEAENHYLDLADLERFQLHIDGLSNSLTVYNLIQKDEIRIFQNVADRLIKDFNQTEESAIELAVCNWITILRYCAIAMVLNHHDFLEIRLLESLKDLVAVRQITVIEARLHELLVEQLSQILTPKQLSLLNPFLEIANNTLFYNSKILNQQELN
jgi:hypothetical protein